MTAFALAVCRRFRLLRNDKTLFLSSEDAANTAAILLAKESGMSVINLPLRDKHHIQMARNSNSGLGMGDLLVSDVHDVLRLVKKSKVGSAANGENQEGIVKSYCSRLRSSNLVDCHDVVKIITEALEDEEKRAEISAFIRDFFVSLGSTVILVGVADSKCQQGGCNHSSLVKISLYLPIIS